MDGGGSRSIPRSSPRVDFEPDEGTAVESWLLLFLRRDEEVFGGSSRSRCRRRSDVVERLLDFPSKLRNMMGEARARPKSQHLQRARISS